ncbi:hypothetical protein PSTT_05277 [Puccinia striiformis]|uniref:RNA-directed DNA polymerase n=1 Tax=Puccinia striiformis TaxID=27350 RepID=A0A2S4VPK6_9BASI|nr:hypothetical protein PSTT_05277 [Puccinia striiformis]
MAELAALQKQFADLMEVVTDERKLRQKAETELAAETAAATAATNLANANALAGPKGPKMGLPDKFDGTRGEKAANWVKQIGVYMIGHPHQFPDDRTKILWSLSYLEGPALTWAGQFHDRLFRNEEVKYDEEFGAAFTSMYLDTERKPRAEAALRKLKQTKSAAEYTHQFNIHASHAGWEAPTLISQYRQGLKSNIRLALLISRVEFTTVAEISNLSLKIDNEINGTDTTANNTATSTTSDPDAMDLSALNGRLSENEKTRMMKAGLCFRCAKKGHLSRDCPEKGKGKGPAKISELEIELQQWRTGERSIPETSRAESSKNGAPPITTSATSKDAKLYPRFLIDSGATHNVLSDLYVESAGLMPLATRSSRLITGFDGSRTTSSYSIRMHLDQDPVPSSFIVTRLKDAYDGILGMPWLEARGNSIDWTLKVVKAGCHGGEGAERRLGRPEVSPLLVCAPQGRMPTNKNETLPRATTVSDQPYVSAEKEITSSPRRNTDSEGGSKGEERDERDKGPANGRTGVEVSPLPIVCTEGQDTAALVKTLSSATVVSKEMSAYHTDHPTSAEEGATGGTRETANTNRKGGSHEEARGEKEGGLAKGKIGVEVSPLSIVCTEGQDTAALVKTLSSATVVSNKTPPYGIDSRTAQQEGEAPTAIQAATASWSTSAKIASDANKMTAPTPVHQLVPPQYHHFLRMFQKNHAQTLPPRRKYDFRVELTPDATPQASRMIPLSPAENTVLEQLVEEGLKNGTIRRTTSPWAAPVLFTGKKDGNLRPCFDYRKLNAVTVKNKYPLPLTMDLVDSLLNADRFTKLDLRNAYGNLRVAEGDKDKLAFICKSGQFAPLTMPFGPTGAPGFFQYFIQDILVDRIGRDTAAYLDDILIYTQRDDDHVTAVADVLETLSKHELWLKPEKCADGAACETRLITDFTLEDYIINSNLQHYLSPLFPSPLLAHHFCSEHSARSAQFMSTRSSNNPILPLTDPEKIIRAANAEKRRLTHLASTTNPANSIAFPTPTHSADPMSSDPANSNPAGSTDPPPKDHTAPFPASSMSTEEMFRAFIQVQHTAALQSTSRMERLEDAILELSLKTEPVERPLALAPGRIDLQKFKTTDGPLYKGPFQAVEPFITWVNGVQIFFATKAVSHPEDKIRVIGCLIRETKPSPFTPTTSTLLSLNPGSTSRSRSSNSRSLRSGVPKYAPRSVISRCWTLRISDFDLAESVNMGSPVEVQNLITNHQVLLADPFQYSDFEFRVAGFHEGLKKLRASRTRPAASHTSTATPSTNRAQGEDIIWRIHAYLDSQGHCHFCKKACGSVPGSCPGPIDRKWQTIPDSFVTPIKPANYKPPMPRGPAPHSAGRPTQPPAGPLEALDEELRQTAEAEYVPGPITPRLLIDFLVCGTRLRALIDSGSEINLISEQAVSQASLCRYPLPKPTSVRLALDDTNSSPIILRHFTVAPLADPDSSLLFDKVPLRIGPISGGHDMILGTPFLAQFCLSLSISEQSIFCTASNIILYDFRQSAAMNHHQSCVSSVASATPSDASYPCEAKEQAILEEFRDLFPLDIPAISDLAEQEGLFTDGSFPAKIQDESSRVRHKIILTDPNAIVNARQYPYPGKHLVAWRTLLDQHRAAGRIRRSTSQYASPSLIIPKKDSSALPRWVCDYRALNELTVKDRSPLPNVDELVRLVASGKVFSILDQTNAFFQTRMREADIPLTAVKTPWGLFEWVVMPMGLTNAPATHQARLEEALGELINDICVVYLDDIVIFSNSFTQHESHVRQVLERLRAANLYCSPKKTKLFRHKIKFLGHWISAEGINPDKDKVSQILDWPSPRSPKGVKKFLGTVQWMKKFIHGLQKYVGTLTPLTSSKLEPKDFKWGKAEESAFNNIKRIMTSLPCLKNVDYESTDPLWLFTDASGSGLGAALFQGKDWKVASPIAYESHLMTAAEKNYPVHEQELLAVIHALQKWKMLLLGMKVNVMSDHHSLIYLMKQRNLSRRQARWTELLADFDLNFEYIRGEDNSVADALSRKDIPDDPPSVNPASIACIAGLVELGTEIADSLKKRVIAGYAGDPYCLSLRKVLPLRDDCVEVDDLLFVDTRLVIPSDPLLRHELITEAHIRLGHLGYLKTLKELRRDFFWPNMAKDTYSTLHSCDTCQRVPDNSPYGKNAHTASPSNPSAGSGH